MSLNEMRRVALEARQELMHMYAQTDFLNAERLHNRKRIIALEVALSAAISFISDYNGNGNAAMAAALRRVLDDDLRRTPRLIVDNSNA